MTFFDLKAKKVHGFTAFRSRPGPLLTSASVSGRFGVKRTVITIGFSPHRIEALPFMREQMEKHELIVLEDAPSPHFHAMLCGEVSIDDYVMEQVAEFPEFEKRLCVSLRDLHRAGKRVVQVEPYLERLLHIHDLFEGKATVQDVTTNPELREVHLEGEVRVNRLVDQLPYRHCRELFGRIRSVKREAAWGMAQDFVRETPS